ncbi:mucin-19-like [Ursus arctos]|uniref:mucin-19-like n=1 Tax=Ursus arctos TaxID=9644 RepID=UPI002017A0EF|nr:mucin-19-like [Ursus arctos]
MSAPNLPLIGEVESPGAESGQSGTPARRERARPPGGRNLKTLRSAPGGSPGAPQRREPTPSGGHPSWAPGRRLRGAATPVLGTTEKSARSLRCPRDANVCSSREQFSRPRRRGSRAVAPALAAGGRRWASRGAGTGEGGQGRSGGASRFSAAASTRDPSARRGQSRGQRAGLSRSPGLVPAGGCELPIGSGADAAQSEGAGPGAGVGRGGAGPGAGPGFGNSSPQSRVATAARPAFPACSTEPHSYPGSPYRVEKAPAKMPSARVLAALLLPARVGPAHTRGYRPAHPKLVSTVPDLSTPGARRLECLSAGRRTQPVLQSTHSRRPLTHAPSWSPTTLQPVLPIHPVSSFTHSPGPFLTRSLRAPSLPHSPLPPHSHSAVSSLTLIPASSSRKHSSPPPPSHPHPCHLPHTLHPATSAHTCTRTTCSVTQALQFRLTPSRQPGSLAPHPSLTHVHTHSAFCTRHQPAPCTGPSRRRSWEPGAHLGPCPPRSSISLPGGPPGLQRRPGRWRSVSGPARPRRRGGGGGGARAPGPQSRLQAAGRTAGPARREPRTPGAPAARRAQDCGGALLHPRLRNLSDERVFLMPDPLC